ncbi:hypothetical protein BTIS_0064 [Bifidobacterium tissieri]|uniref:Uncharacterized protein n=1 Tax=Bifidobacterium tissieri TaxID=1630162 RepID=A0A261FK37_9BIFI|nr:hypothetical protein [Bifidobacterium tissieri]OZG59333.1 hypothetical protein BTIS_0064 [Bifidobacterium tissieri]
MTAGNPIAYIMLLLPAIILALAGLACDTPRDDHGGRSRDREEDDES